MSSYQHVFTGDLSIEQGQWYASSVYLSIEKRLRRDAYKRLIAGLKEGEVLLAVIEFYTPAERIQVRIQDFFEFDMTMDQIKARRGYIKKYFFLYVPQELVEINP